MKKEIHLNDTCMATSISMGTKLPVSIVAIRDAEMRQNASSPVPSQLYYVHYVGYDRRLDEWLPISALDLSTLETPPPEVPSDSSHKKRRCTTTGTASMMAGRENALEELEKEVSCDARSINILIKLIYHHPDTHTTQITKLVINLVTSIIIIIFFFSPCLFCNFPF